MAYLECCKVYEKISTSKYLDWSKFWKKISLEVSPQDMENVQHTPKPEAQLPDPVPDWTIQISLYESNRMSVSESVCLFVFLFPNSFERTKPDELMIPFGMQKILG